MNRVEPFSKIDQILQSSGGSGCLVDANLLVASTSLEPHPFYDDAAFLFEKFSQYEVPLYTTVTVRTEYLDVIRRQIITEKLMEIYADSSRFKLAEAVKKELKTHRTWLDVQAAKNELPILPDQRIKSCKQAFDPRNHSGKLGWMAFCDTFLKGQLIIHWEKLQNELGINYLQLRGSESEKYLLRPIEWEAMYAISEQSGVSSNDAMILNAFATSKFEVLATADYDVGYAVLAGNFGGKICLVPDRLYRNRLKGFRKN